MGYDETIAYLEALPTPEKWNLEIPAELATAAGVRFNYPVMHIAGTNGKGSVCAFLSSILQAQGCKVGMYTSPHLNKYNERIQIDGKPISDAGFEKMILDLKPHIEKMRKAGKCPSAFEALTIAAFKFFEAQGIDFLVLETGMGGRLDATNIAPSRFQAITTISLDHMHNLGNTLGKIAYEKAGIIKEGSRVSAGRMPPSALKQIAIKCAKTGSKLSVLGRDFNFNEPRVGTYGGKFNYVGRKLRLDDLETPLLGRHQLENASVALSVIENMAESGIALSDTAIRKGLKHTKWPGRLEPISHKPEILLDGAHNVEGMRSLKRSLAEIFPKTARKKLILVMAVMADKEYGKMIREIAPLADKIIFTRASIERSATPEMLVKAAKGGKTAKKADIAIKNTIPEAIKFAKSIAREADTICITGSLYTVGEARACLLGNKQYRPHSR